jgi:hypothetical protein
MDHVIPKSRGGRTTWENVAAACKSCNAAKNDKLPKGKWMPRQKLYAPTYGQLLSIRRKFPIVIYDERWGEFLPNWTGDIIIREPSKKVA